MSERVERRLWAVAFLLVLLFGPTLADAVTGRATLNSDIHWIKSWLQTAGSVK